MRSSRWAATVAPGKDGGGLGKGDSEREVFKGGGFEKCSYGDDNLPRYIFPEKAVENICVGGSVSDPYVGN